MPNLKEAENMALLVDGYCSLFKNTPTLWLRESSVVVPEEEDDGVEKNRHSNNNSIQTKKKAVRKWLDTAETSTTSIVQSAGDDYGSSSLDTAINFHDLAKFNNISVHSLVFQEKIGSGQFGDVYRAIYNNKHVSTVNFAI
jgi:hypothetical protein